MIQWIIALANFVSWLTHTLATKSTDWKYITEDNIISTLFVVSYVLEVGGSQEIQGRWSGYSCSYWLGFSRFGHTWCENSEYRVLLWFFLWQNCNCKQFLLYSLRSSVPMWFRSKERSRNDEDGIFGFGRAKYRSWFFSSKPHGNACYAGYLLHYELLYLPPQPYM